TAWYGPAAGVLALAAYAVSPEPLAHGSLVGVDVPTGLTFFGATLAFVRFARSRGLRAWGIAAAWFAAAFLVRFSAVQLAPTCVLVLVALSATGGLRNPRRAWLGLAGLLVVAWAAILLGYLGQGAFQSLGRLEVHSDRFVQLQHLLPWLPVPLPEAYFRGLDYLAYLGQSGIKQSLFLGHVASAPHLASFPLALLIKVPLGWLAVLVARAARTV